MLFVCNLRNKVHQDHKQGRRGKIEILTLKLINSLLNSESAIILKLSIEPQVNYKNSWFKIAPILILDLEPYLYHKLRNVHPFSWWSQWVTPDQIQIFWRGSRLNHHGHLFFCSITQHPFRNVGRQDWNEKVCFNFWILRASWSSAHSLLLWWRNPHVFYCVGLFNVGIGIRYLCQLCIIECFVDCEEKNNGNSFRHHPNALKCSIVFLSIDIWSPGRLRRAVIWGLLKRRNIFHRSGHFWSFKFLRVVFLPKVRKGETWRRKEKEREARTK